MLDLVLLAAQPRPQRPAVLDVLPALKKRFGRLACLSNDVASWSKKLRQRFELERWIDAWFISGDLGVRKPSPEIYVQAMAQLGVKADTIVFVDDRPRNLDAAQQLGIHTVLFDARGAIRSSRHRKIGGLAELLL